MGERSMVRSVRDGSPPRTHFVKHNRITLYFWIWFFTESSTCISAICMAWQTLQYYMIVVSFLLFSCNFIRSGDLFSRKSKVSLFQPKVFIEDAQICIKYLIYSFNPIIFCKSKICIKTKIFIYCSNIIIQ